MHEPSLIDIAIEGLPEDLIEQVGNLIATVTALLGNPLQVQLRVQVGLLLLEVVLQVVGHMP